MKALVLYSGGKDSSLVAYLLDMLGYKPKLLTANFGIVPDSIKTAQDAAKIIGFEHEILKLDSKVIEEAAEIAEKDGFPLNAINHVHKYVLEETCKNFGKEFPIIADGCRRDDRTPKLTLAEMQSLEDRYNIEYFTPLGGISYKTIRNLANDLFELREIVAGSEPTSEYETEIRALLREKDKKLEQDIFPKEHTQSIVLNYNAKKEVSQL